MRMPASRARSCSSRSRFSSGAGGKAIAPALKRIADAKAPFVSRGDKSGTHAAELRYFKEALAKLRAEGAAA